VLELESDPHRQIWQTIADRLRLAIVEGELRPGTRLLEQDLAGSLGVSRGPVREALSRLAQEGLVAINPRRGANVLGLSAADLRDLYGLRQVLEAYAARLVAAAASDADLDALQAVVDRMEALRRRGHLSRLADPDLAFHRRLVVLSGSRRVAAAWELTAGPLPALLSLTDSAYYARADAVATHQTIVDALRSRDPDRAAAAIGEHLTRAQQTLAGIVGDRGTASGASRGDGRTTPDLGEPARRL
jgi:DNA-binding GntR family transcriptional regulator